mgnify:FL=1
MCTVYVVKPTSQIDHVFKIFRMGINTRANEIVGVVACMVVAFMCGHTVALPCCVQFYFRLQ